MLRKYKSRNDYFKENDESNFPWVSLQNLKGSRNRDSLAQGPIWLLNKGHTSENPRPYHASRLLSIQIFQDVILSLIFTLYSMYKSYSNSSFRNLDNLVVIVLLFIRKEKKKDLIEFVIFVRKESLIIYEVINNPLAVAYTRKCEFFRSIWSTTNNIYIVLT